MRQRIIKGGGHKRGLRNRWEMGLPRRLMCSIDGEILGRAYSPDDEPSIAQVMQDGRDLEALEAERTGQDPNNPPVKTDVES